MVAEVHIMDDLCFFVVEPRAVGPHTPKEDNAFLDADVRLLTVKFRQPSHEFTFCVDMSFVLYPLVLTPLV
jgi:hypothetical protein